MALATVTSLPKTLRAFLLVGTTVTTGLFGGAYLGRTAMAAGADPYRPLDTLAIALHHVQAQYLSEVTTQDMVYGAIGGMMDTLDPHSRFLDPSALDASQARTEGVYTGVGIEMKMISQDLTVVRVVPGSPADTIMETGDLVLAVDGEPHTTLAAASNAMRGEVGTSVKLTTRRGDKEHTVQINRARIRDRTVRVTNIGNGWAIAEISRFQRNTASDLDQGIRTAAPSRGLIIDVRNNGGGLLDEAIDVVDLFATEGLIVRTRGRNDVALNQHDATTTAPHRKLRLIVLINGESASASEIVAGSLRALAGAQLVGTQTYGKWSVQRLYVFEDTSAIKLTVAQYEIVDENAGGAGLEPNHRVEAPTPQTQALTTLRETLAHDGDALALLDGLVADIPQKVANTYLGPLSERLTQDPQLAAAWTLALDTP